MSLVFLVITLAVMIVAFVAIYQAYRFLGENDIGFSFLEGGAGKIIVRGKSPQKFLINHPGFFINDPDSPDFIDSEEVMQWEIISKEAYQRIKRKRMPDNRSFLAKEFGIYRIARWPFDQVLEYMFRWIEWVQKDGKTVYEPCPRHEKTKIFFVKAFPYFSRIENLLITGNILFDVEYLANLKIVVPPLAFFGNKDWLGGALALLDEAVRNWVAKQSLEQLLSQTDEHGNEGAEKTLNMALLQCNAELRVKFGCELVNANFLKLVDKNDATGKLRDALNAVIIAEREAAALDISSKAQAAAKERVGLAEAKVLRAMEEAGVAGDAAFAKAYEGQEGTAMARALLKTQVSTLVTGGGSGLLLNTQQSQKQKGEQAE